MFWKCSLAKQAWLFVSKWLEINIDGFEYFTLEDSFKIIAHKDFKVGGGLCLAAMFWTIWLTRNDLVFKNQRLSTASLESLIINRSYSWGLSNKILLPNQLSAWHLNPKHLLSINTRVAKRNLVSYWSEISTIVGFIDGAWKSNDLSTKAGIGGFLISNLNSLKFIFSGPSSNSSPYDTELEAFMFLLSHIVDSIFKHDSITIFSTIFSDSMSLVNNLHNLRSDINFIKCRGSSMIHKVHLVHIDRILNSEADKLAKEGMARNRMIAAWV